MISSEEYIQLKAFARQDGILMGLLWVVALACFVGSMTTPLLQFGFIVGVIATPFVMLYRLRHFRDKVLDGYIPYGRAVLFCTLTMVYASLITAAATLVYFYFIDNGLMMNTLRNNIEIPEVRQSLAQAGISPDELEQQIEEVGKARPIDFAISICCNGIVTSFLLSLLVGLAYKKRKH